MDINARFEFYKELYLLELERKNELGAVVQVRLAALIFSVSIMLYMLKTFQFDHEYVWVPIVFIVSSLLSSILFSYIAWSLYKAYWGEVYERLPNINDLEKYRKKLENEEILKENPNLYMEYIIEEMCVCTESNSNNNDKRHITMNKAMKKLNWAIVLFVVSGSIYLIADLDSSSPRKPTDIRIIEMRQNNDR